METALYSALHFLVDGVCAFAMFGRFLPRGDAAFSLLFYNFCAFALQLPLGLLLDLHLEKRGEASELPLLTAAAGAAVTVLGAFTSPVVLGIGNALFHVGGGVGTILTDHRKGLKGRALGCFVAPGALGLFFGTGLGKAGELLYGGAAAAAGGAMLLLLAGVAFLHRGERGDPEPAEALRTLPAGPEIKEKKAPGDPGPVFRRELLITGCAFCVVILRSLCGFWVQFPWKTAYAASLLAVLMTALGKAGGGFLAARFGAGRTAACTLTAAAVCYLLGGTAVFGLSALFLFNMTMPVTLYLLADRYRRRPGSFFGLLTFGLFLGFLPELLTGNAGASSAAGALPGPFSGGSVTGAGIAVLSLLLLLPALGAAERSPL